MLRWMAPFLSFTAEEAWEIIGSSDSIFIETYSTLPATDDLLAVKWERLLEIRAAANKEIEAVREQGQVGSSLQANLTITAPSDDLAALQSLGDDLKFIFITSQVTLQAGDALAISVTPSSAQKCERCWHYRDDVGINPEHPTICGRCDSNLHGAGEAREFA